MVSTARMIEVIRAQAAHAGAGAALIRHPGAALATLEQAWRMLALGGIVVRTPNSDDALLATTVQLDGDLVTIVRGDLFANGDDAQRALWLEEHSQALGRTVLPLAPIKRGVAAIRAAILVLAAGLQAPMLAEVFLARLHFAQHVTRLLLLELPSLLMYGLYWCVPRVIGWLLRTRIAPVLREWRETSQRHVAAMSGGGQPHDAGMDG